ncbi:hypothetical protein Hypma_001332 [Hypsizygus marmoreus]|uniref:Uncharacterized protein n=1 Tax=Hypsizygus marmoreus TaxID=39966 RepID=A0A369K2H6_HYPMA|nr:hypothetical protein Hypma_001332 [Hypsizygus marmoreus]
MQYGSHPGTSRSCRIRSNCINVKRTPWSSLATQLTIPVFTTWVVEDSLAIRDATTLVSDTQKVRRDPPEYLVTLGFDQA